MDPGTSLVLSGMQTGFHAIGQGIAAMLFGDPAAEARAAQARRQAELQRQATAAAEAERRRQEFERKKTEYTAEKRARQARLNRNLALLGGGPGPGVVDLTGMSFEQANQNLMAAQSRMLRERLDREREMRWVRIDRGVPELSPEARARAEVRADDGEPLLTKADLLEVSGEALIEALGTRLGPSALGKVGGVVGKAGDFGIKWIDEGRAWMDERNAGLDKALEVQRSAGQRIRQLEEGLQQMPPGSEEHTRMSYELASRRVELRRAEALLREAGAKAPTDAVRDSLLDLRSFARAGLKSLDPPGPLKDAAKYGFGKVAQHRWTRKFLARVPGLKKGLGKAATGLAGKVDGALGWDDNVVNPGVDARVKPLQQLQWAK